MTNSLSVPSERLFPDAELLLIGLIRAMDLTWRVVTDLPANMESVLPVIQVTRIGGSTRYAALLDRPRMDIDIYAATRLAAANAGRKIQSKMPTIRGITASGGVITDVTEELGVSWRPDRNENIRRMGMTFVLGVRPA